MSLVNYSSSSSSGDESDCSDADDEPKAKLAKLPVKSELLPKQIETKGKFLLPKATAQLGVKSNRDEDENVDDPAQHGGRIRTFKHERGNWATYIYIPIPMENCLLDEVQEQCKTLLEHVVQLQPCADLHISLSRTVTLPYHLIDSFVKTLEQQLETSNSFSICLRNLKIYTNEEQTRTFVAFKVDELYVGQLHKLMLKVNTVMGEYKLPSFYKNPSFHISFLWCLGDKEETIKLHYKAIESVITALQFSENFSIVIDKLHCRSGNKNFTFTLKK